jgi:hypothetical protein
VAFSTAGILKVMSGDSAHGWVIAIPPLSVVIDIVLHTAAQFGGQDFLYKVLGNHAMNQQILALLLEGRDPNNPVPPLNPPVKG